MARLFDEIFKERGSGDIELVVAEEVSDLGTASAITLRCHSIILTQHPYFFKMLSTSTPLREGRTKEVLIVEPQAYFIELVRYMYTSQVDINRSNVAGLLTLADKYCIDEVVDLSLKHIKESFDADTFFTFYNFTTLNSAYQDKLKDQLLTALRQRRNLCAITEDVRWHELPPELVEMILAEDDLPIASEAEILTLIVQWLGPHRPGTEADAAKDMARLLGAFRKCDNIWVRVSDIEQLMTALGVDIFSSREPRTGAAVWDPSFTIHRHEAAGPSAVGVVPAEATERQECDLGEVWHQLGPKDFLQQEPGWMHPGVHRCRVSLTCSSWSHRERRLLRGSPTQGNPLQKRVFECGSAKPSGHERSPSPPPAFQVRMPPMEAFETFDIAQMSDAGEQGVLSGSSIIRNLSQGRDAPGRAAPAPANPKDKIDHELVDHQIICGISSGNQRHGLRISQRERNAIYLIEDLNGKQSLNVGGTISNVSFDLELVIGEASNCGISRCRFALIRNMHTLLEEWFDVSARAPIRFYISSSYFDKSSSYTVSLRWLRPLDPQGRPLPSR